MLVGFGELQDVYVDELRAELAQLTQRAEAAEAAAAAHEDSLAQVKDKFVRLNADYDNFRKRTVCSATSCCAVFVVLIVGGHSCSIEAVHCRLYPSCCGHADMVSGWNIIIAFLEMKRGFGLLHLAGGLHTTVQI